ncbi:MAG: hypothetical protein HY548_01695 [Elusimicrobia bacterium]|nr:hypothetical protein [Elusimicrobiota bacterium]
MRDSLDAVTLYFHGIKRLPDISKEEMAELWKRSKKGDKKASRRLVEAQESERRAIANELHDG